MPLRNLIADVLNKTPLSYDIDEKGAFYIFEGLPLPLWIEITNGGKFLKFFTYLNIRSGVADPDVHELVNDINAHYFPNSVSYRWGKLWSYFYIPVQIIHTQADLVEMMVLSGGNFLSGVRDLDKRDLVV